LQGGEASRAETQATAENTAEAAADANHINETRRKQLPGEIDQARKEEGIQEHTDRVTETLNRARRRFE
jgi:hypothetical protein